MRFLSFSCKIYILSVTRYWFLSDDRPIVYYSGVLFRETMEKKKENYYYYFNRYEIAYPARSFHHMQLGGGILATIIMYCTCLCEQDFCMHSFDHSSSAIYPPSMEDLHPLEFTIHNQQTVDQIDTQGRVSLDVWSAHYQGHRQRQNTDKGHTLSPWIQIQIDDSTGNRTRAAGLEGRDSTGNVTMTDLFTYEI